MTMTAERNARPNALPGRRERLRVMMALQSQRRLLIAALATVVVIAAIAAALFVRDAASPDVIPIGKGVAGIDTPAANVTAGSDTAAEAGTPAAAALIGEGEASFYGSELAGNPTATGEIFDPEKLTAAHRSLPLGSQVRVTNLRNGERVRVRINDRGPYHGNRVIDLSTAAARSIGMLNAGVAPVRIALIQ
ncbi:MAG: septal ring lytic transglycosylase RlpA family protein [Pacificimonas sp.]|nr:septal ring lytic transglycosylase RlpA family protein [Pacificimonas sp.]